MSFQEKISCHDAFYLTLLVLSVISLFKLDLIIFSLFKLHLIIFPCPPCFVNVASSDHLHICIIIVLNDLLRVCLKDS